MKSPKYSSSRISKNKVENNADSALIQSMLLDLLPPDALPGVKNKVNKKIALKKKVDEESNFQLGAFSESFTGSAASEITVPAEESHSPLLYADAGLTKTDASSNDSAGHAEGSSEGLSSAALAILGLVGVGSIAAIVISNNKNSSSSSDNAAPVAVSVTANSSNQTVSITYNETLDPLHLPQASSFVVTTNGASNPVSSLVVNGNVLTLTLTNAFSPGPLTLEYTDPSSANDANAIQDNSGNDASSFIRGIVADGYIRGARIYLDLNNDGIANSNEFTGITTDENGSFFLPNAISNLAIIAVGGINIDTGLEQLTPLKAPAGSSTINPITTLVQAVIDHAARNNILITSEEASNDVATVLGIQLPNGLTLANFNPLAQPDDAASIAAQKIAAQIATIINVAASSDQAIANTIFSNAANLLTRYSELNHSIDMGGLTNSQVQGLLSGAGVSNASGIANTIVNANAAIENAVNINAISNAQQLLASNSNPYQDTVAPNPLTLRLARDTGISSTDNDSTNGLIKVAVESNNLHTNSWEYSTNIGASWLSGSGDSFVLPNGRYAANAIKVRETDASGNSTTSTIADAITITAPTTSPPTVPDLLALAGGGFKAMAADAGMLAGVLKYYNTDSDLTNNVTLASLLHDDLAISANSGSTWFVNLLAFSDSFNASLNDYTKLFSVDGMTLSRGDITTGGSDGFFGVMGEAYQDYLKVDLNDVKRVIAADIARIRSLDDFVSFIQESPFNLARIIVTGASDGGEWLLDKLNGISGIGAISSKLRDIFSSIAPLKDYIDVASVALMLGVDWNTFMQEIVFAPDNTDLLLKDINFYTSDSSDNGSASNRTSTLSTQSLIYELALIADEAAIGPKTKTGLASNTALASILNKEATYEMLPFLPNFLSPDGTYNFIPVTSTSIGKPNNIAAPWLPSIKSGDLYVEYDSDAWFDFGTKKTFNDLNFEGLSAFLSSSISSSAGALGASYGVLGDTTSIAGAVVNLLDVLTGDTFSDVVLDYAKGLAPLVKVTTQSGVASAGDPAYLTSTNFADPIGTITSSAAAYQGYLRMADGGYFDNSSVTSGLSYLEANQSDWIAHDNIKDFEITLFVFSGIGDTVSTTLKDRGFSDDISSVVERIFRDGKQQSVSILGVDILDLSHPNSAVFESSSSVTGMSAPVWTYAYTKPSDAADSSLDGFAMKAFEIDVKTFDGNTMNIGGGYEGTLNLWNIISDTGAIPLQPSGTFLAPEFRTWNDYSLMYDQIIAGLQTSSNGDVGAILLADHLGYAVL